MTERSDDADRAVDESPSIAPEALAERLRSGEELTVLDVRDRDEFERWHLEGESVDAVQIPHMRFIQGQATGDVGDLAADLEEPIVAVCGRGEASAHAVGLLRDAGIDARNLAGGMDAWADLYVARELEVDAPATVVQYDRPSSGCLAYAIYGGGEAAVIDPLRAFVDRYVDDAAERSSTSPASHARRDAVEHGSTNPASQAQQDAAEHSSASPASHARRDAAERGAKIRYAVDTHVHADHVSGVRALAKRTGAEPVVPEGATDRGLAFDATTIGDGDELRVGDATLTAVATPGHTTESLSFRLGDVLFTGDTLFLEGVGRPDLERSDDGAGAAAGRLYESLRHRLSAFPDETTIAPGHYSEAADPGADGTYTARLEALSDRLAALSMTEDEFVAHATNDLPPRPSNHERIVAVNLGLEAVDGETAFELELGPNNCAVAD